MEPIDFDTDADVMGITGFLIHTQRMFEFIHAFRRRGKLAAVRFDAGADAQGRR
jgi:hypothetical protein